MDYPRTRNVSTRPDPVKTNISSRRSLSSSSSFSSFSSCSSSSIVFSGDHSPLNSPTTPLHLLGVPFSWEKHPGKPKENSHKLKLLNHHRNNESSNLLPLPPHRNIHSPATGKTPKSKGYSKKNPSPTIVRDPFAVALLQCSKDEDNSEEEDDGKDVNHGGSSKALSKSNLGNRLGLMNLYGSCRRTCSVSESIVYLPRLEKDDHLLLPRRRR